MAPNINCRWEGADKKPMWRDAWVSARCLIPGTHWYEWRSEAGQKILFVHAPVDGRGFMFAGLYSRVVLKEGESPALTTAIITRDAAPSIAHIHDLMLIVLHPFAWRRWIDPAPVSVGAVRTHAGREFNARRADLASQLGGQLAAERGARSTQADGLSSAADQVWRSVFTGISFRRPD